MAGDLTIDAGSTMQMAGATPLSAATHDFRLGHQQRHLQSFDWPAGGDLNVGGSWTNNATFNHNGRTVNLNGSIGQTVSGNTTFFNLTKASSTTQTLTFAAGSTQTVTNALTLNCASPQLLSLRSYCYGHPMEVDCAADPVRELCRCERQRCERREHGNCHQLG